MALLPIKKERLEFCDYPSAQPPRYREYYPRFNLYEARREIKRGRDCCEFWMLGHKLGELVVREDRPGDSITIQSANTVKYASGMVTQRFKFVATPTGDNEKREAIRCPRCGERRLVMFCVRDWACAQCHGLRLRSQLVDSRALKAEKLRQLEREIAAGRPKGTHRRTFGKLLTRHRALLAQLGGDPDREIGLKHALVTTTRWITSAEASGRLLT